MFKNIKYQIDKIHVSSITSERIELESMLRCLNDRLNEPNIFYYRFWEIGALFRYVCRGKAHFALLWKWALVRQSYRNIAPIFQNL